MLNQRQKEIIENIKQSCKPVIICGAGIVGKILFELCNQNGIKIEAFCDSSIKTVGTEFCGFKVLYTPDLKERYNDAVLIISVAAIKDVVDLLESIGFSDWYAGGVLLKKFDILQSNLDASIDYSKFAIENCILCHEGYLDKYRLFFRSVDFIITERCSLRCRDCSNLMQYYKSPKDCDLDLLYRSIDRFFNIVDDVMDFRIIGGDAFMSRQWHLIVDYLSKNEKIRRIVLYTNGTILPKAYQIESLKKKNVLVIITDYGKLSNKLKELKNILAENHILHHVLEVDEWLDCSTINKNRRSDIENEEIFTLCCAKNMPTLSDGKLFRCPYAANAHRLSAVPFFSEDFVNIFESSVVDKKIEIREYLNNRRFLYTCDYCNGRPLSGVEVAPAVQTNQPLSYHRY